MEWETKAVANTAYYSIDYEFASWLSCWQMQIKDLYSSSLNACYVTSQFIQDTEVLNALFLDVHTVEFLAPTWLHSYIIHNTYT